MPEHPGGALLRGGRHPEPAAAGKPAGGRAEHRAADTGEGRGREGPGGGRGFSAPTPGGAARQGGSGAAMAEAVVPCRVQYLEDADPFGCGSFPEPRRAPVYAVEEALALGVQLPALHRLLGAPLPVRGSREKAGRPPGRAGVVGWKERRGEGWCGVSPPERGQRSRSELRQNP